MRRRMAILASAMLAFSIAFAPGAPAAAPKPKPKPEAGPALKSASAIVVDAKTGDVIYEHDAGAVAPIASVTKLMTALVVLDAEQPLDEIIEIKASDRWKGKGAFSHLPTGAKLSRGDLLRLALM